MNKAQEEDIEYLRKLHPKIYWIKPNGPLLEEDKLLKKAIETVLNMLKEKDKEINRKSSTIKALQCALHERTEERDRKDNIITRQNKQIDLMAEHIVSSAIVDDTVCAIKCDCETDIEEDCTHEKMLICTKQYFERKVEDEIYKI